MPLDFPASPTLNQIYTFDNASWRWDGSVWIRSDAVADLVIDSLTVSENSTGDAVRITQTGTGNALVVEDSANPDSTPIVVDASGNLIVGHTAVVSGDASDTQLIGTDANRLAMHRYSADDGSPQMTFLKSRNATIGSHTAVASGDGLGLIYFRGSDGTAFQIAGMIQGLADGTVSSGVVPGTLRFLTANSAGTLTERLNINSAGTVTFPNSSIIQGAIVDQLKENWNISNTAATGTVNMEIKTASAWYFTLNASANWTFNFRGNSTTTLCSMLEVGDSITIAFAVTNGSTAYRPTVFKIDENVTGFSTYAVTVTPKWQSGVSPTSGNINSVDMYNFTILKTGDYIPAATPIPPTYTVFASQTKFA